MFLWVSGFGVLADEQRHVLELAISKRGRQVGLVSFALIPPRFPALAGELVAGDTSFVSRGEMVQECTDRAVQFVSSS